MFMALTAFFYKLDLFSLCAAVCGRLSVLLVCIFMDIVKVSFTLNEDWLVLLC